MLTKEQIKATKDQASGEVKYWFTGHQAQTKLVLRPVDGPDELGATPDDKKQYERVPMSLAEYVQEKIDYIMAGKERLMGRFGYTEESFNEKLELYNESFWRCHALRQKNTDKHDKVIARYKQIFDEASKIAAAVDVSDIKDGFPCGSVHLYLTADMQETDLGKAVAFQNRDSNTDAYKYSISHLVKIPSYGQCTSFDERTCGKTKEFLDSKGIKVNKHTWID